MFGKLENKVAIVTGSGQGIGAGIARVFAAAGAKVMIATRTAAHGEETLAEISAAGGTAALTAVLAVAGPINQSNCASIWWLMGQA